MSRNKVSELSAQRTVGVGSERIYLYFYENDRRLARNQGQERWECKIGCTRRGLEERLLEQGLVTSSARHPVVALEILTDHAHVLETRIHRALQSRKVSHGVGDEWYMTSPEEVEGIYRELIPSMAKLNEVLNAFHAAREAFEADSAEAFGNALRSIRSGLGASQVEVAKSAEIRQASLSKIENGSDGTRLDTLLKVLRTYGYRLLIIKID